MLVVIVKLRPLELPFWRADRYPHGGARLIPGVPVLLILPGLSTYQVKHLQVRWVYRHLRHTIRRLPHPSLMKRYIRSWLNYNGSLWNLSSFLKKMSPLGHVTLSRRGAGNPVIYNISFFRKKSSGKFSICHDLIMNHFSFFLSASSAPLRSLREKLPVNCAAGADEWLFLPIPLPVLTGDSYER